MKTLLDILLHTSALVLGLGLEIALFVAIGSYLLRKKPAPGKSALPPVRHRYAKKAPVARPEEPAELPAFRASVPSRP